MNLSLEKPKLSDLTHFGVLGMHWGVRKSEKSLKNRSQLTDAQKKARLQKILLIAGGVTLTAAIAATAAYSIKKRGILNSVYGTYSNATTDYTKLIDEADHLIPKGSTIHRVSDAMETNFRGDRLFASINKSDSARYKVLFERHLKTTGLYNISLKTLNDIKVPSEKKQYEIFVDMLKNDTNGLGKEFLDPTPFFSFIQGKTVIESAETAAQFRYKRFARNLIDPEYTPGNIFKDHLKSLGYNGVFDANDAGSYARSPIMVLDPTVNLAIQTANRISRGEKIAAVMLARKSVSGGR